MQALPPMPPRISSILRMYCSLTLRILPPPTADISCLSTMAKTMIAFMIVLGLGAMFGAWELNHQTKVLHDWTEANNVIAEIDYLTSEVRLKQYAHLISASTVEFNQHEAEIEELKAEIDAMIVEYEKTIDSELERQYFDAAKAAWPPPVWPPAD